MCDRPTWVIGLVQNGHGERLDTSSRDPGGIPKYPGEQCDPTGHVKRHPGTEEPHERSPPRWSRSSAACACWGGISQEAKAWGNAQDMLTWERWCGREGGE